MTTAQTPSDAPAAEARDTASAPFAARHIGTDDAATACRVKNHPVSGSEWYPASTIEPPCSAMKVLIRATMPTSSGQPRVST